VDDTLLPVLPEEHDVNTKDNTKTDNRIEINLNFFCIFLPQFQEGPKGIHMILIQICKNFKEPQKRYPPELGSD
jgi:hypothetical protein